MDKEKRKTTIYLPSELVEAIKQRAKANQRSFNSEIVWTLDQSIKESKDASTQRS